MKYRGNLNCILCILGVISFGPDVQPLRSAWLDAKLSYRE